MSCSGKWGNKRLSNWEDHTVSEGARFQTQHLYPGPPFVTTAQYGVLNRMVPALLFCVRCYCHSSYVVFRFKEADIKISMKAHGDVNVQGTGRLTGQSSLKSPSLFNQEILGVYVCICKFSITYHWGRGFLGTTSLVGGDRICILRLSGLKCRNRFFWMGVSGRGITLRSHWKSRSGGSLD